MERGVLHLAVAVEHQLQDLSLPLQLLEVMRVLPVGTTDAAQHACLLQGGGLWPYHRQHPQQGDILEYLLHPVHRAEDAQDNLGVW